MINVHDPKGFVGNPDLEPPFSRGDYTWKTTYEVPEKVPEYENEPIYEIEVGEVTYLYDDVMIAMRDMIAFDAPIRVYRWDPKYNRYAKYVEIEQVEVAE